MGYYFALPLQHYFGRLSMCARVVSSDSGVVIPLSNFIFKSDQGCPDDFAGPRVDYATRLSFSPAHLPTVRLV